MVVISRVTTRAGDAGSTRLADMSRVAKTDRRVAAVGAVAEANAHLGLALQAAPPAAVAAVLERLRQELFDLGADLSTPLPAPDAAAEPVLRVTEAHVAGLEADAAALGADLPVLRSFVLPGGGEAAARLHLAATVVRRAERAAWAAAEAFGLDAPGGLGSMALAYLNRLSDLVFTAARASSTGEVLWDSRRDGYQVAEPCSAKPSSE